jgi:hypothetical protein
MCLNNIIQNTRLHREYEELFQPPCGTPPEGCEDPGCLFIGVSFLAKRRLSYISPPALTALLLGPILKPKGLTL